MAKKRVVNPDNLYTFDVCGEEVECVASLGASVTYKEEFIGRLERPYTGILEADLPVMYRRTLREVTVEADADGNPVLLEDGTMSEVPSDYEGSKAVVPNPDFFGQDVEEALRFVWAMARAAHSVDEPWDEWSARVMASSLNMRAQRQLFERALYEVALRHWFLDPEGRVDAQEQD